MRELQALIWKEWRETRLFLVIAWGLFIGLPIIGGLEGLAMYAHHFEFSASDWIFPWGPLLAIVIGVASTCRDLDPKLEDFWQSRPIGTIRLFLVKFLFGELVVLVACSVPLIIELIFNRSDTAASVTWILPVCLASYGIAVLAGCVLRRTAYAAAVTLVGLLLLFVLPSIFPCLSGFDIDATVEQLARPHISLGPIWDYPQFQLGEKMLAVATCTSILGLLAVRFRWRIESGQPLIYGAASAAFLILIGSASYQLGTNLPVLQAVDLSMPPTASLTHVVLNGSSGMVYGTDFASNDIKFFSRTLQLSGEKMIVGPPVATWHDDLDTSPSMFTVVNQRDSTVQYSLIEDSATSVQLEVGRRRTAYNGYLRPETIELWRENRAGLPYWTNIFLYAWSDRLYVCGRQTVVFDTTNPLSPKRIFDSPLQWSPDDCSEEGVAFTQRLPPTPELPAMERLKFALRCYEARGWAQAFDGKILCRSWQGAEPQFSVLRLKSLSNDKAAFELVGFYRRRLVQRLAGGIGISSLGLSNGLIYATSASAGFVSVFEIGASKSIHQIAHFAAPGVINCTPLPDGRAIASGTKLWLLGPPPR